MTDQPAGDDRAVAISRELARLRRQAMFGLLSEEDQARRSRLLVERRTLEGERVEEVQGVSNRDDSG